MLNKVRHRLIAKESQIIKFIIFDFSLVNSLDSSAVLSFNKISNLAQNHQIKLVFTNLEPKIKDLLIQGEVWDKQEKSTQDFSDLEQALKWCGLKKSDL